MNTPTNSEALPPTSGSPSLETPTTDRLEYGQECGYEVCWEDHARAMERALRASLVADNKCDELNAMLNSPPDGFGDGWAWDCDTLISAKESAYACFCELRDAALCLPENAKENPTPSAK